MVRMFKFFAPAIAVLGLALTISPTQAADSPVAGGGTVAGTVVDSSGKGIEGAMIKVMKPRERAPKGAEAKADAAKPKREAIPAVAEGTSGAEGKFSLANVPAGEYMVMATAKGAGRGMGKVSVKAGETATVTLTLQEGKRGAGGKKPEAKLAQ
jgi:hypothetical protein